LERTAWSAEIFIAFSITVIVQAIADLKPRDLLSFTEGPSALNTGLRPPRTETLIAATALYRSRTTLTALIHLSIAVIV